MPDSQTQKSVSMLIEREVAEVSRLLGALEHEYAALLASDLAALKHTVDEKHATLERLDALERERQKTLRAAGYSTDFDGTRACLAAGSDEDRALWDKLVAQLRVCALHNRRNGEIVRHSCQRIQMALALLRGTPFATTDIALDESYGPSGEEKRQSTLPSRLLACA